MRQNIPHNIEFVFNQIEKKWNFMYSLNDLIVVGVNFLSFLMFLLHKTCQFFLWEYMWSARGGGLPYESDGDARRKIRIKPLKETNLGVAQALCDP